ncbi:MULTISPECIES: aspartate--ammonia ligase [Breznakia]|uniref:Aspartate--ammonia ligase n=1 Tax=Breznakia blatticola TaxID=1754012 RepID=A0A4R8A5Y3_9FIRM|nr:MULTISPECIES: aspartate--ammonia ligase [Breznakia]MDH6366920.1 aspartate--ammonia ligase [Breznakia sp. PH1-1]MDH6404098.1 aspartate--ammonia ligase [Breznakia sp. PF1-11]MDH6411807.1 aspartate--ammonia ligase [Breznakia sp. PFB1-11]MDH6414086.1 aspartate--ammonia ligase [Breznakia sp. PFB1-14]MDH6416557.1 aspartate--ammonia ligase [Breznakia sp. PFB1-4]
MGKTFIPDGYKPTLSLLETEIAIKFVKDMFERRLGEALHLTRVSAPLFVQADSGLNDDLNGVERPIDFVAPDVNDRSIEIVHSLAKWKRDALKRYGLRKNEGLYTDMNAIRRDEELDNYHSIYVDQWDWEVIITPKQRTLDYLQTTVRKIYDILLEIEYMVIRQYPQIGDPILPEKIHFISSQELEDMYPDLSPKEREDRIVKAYGAVFLMGIGDTLRSGKKHDGRAPDYDDWTLNGDILVWYPVLEMSLELSSMGIRVNDKKLDEQLKKADAEARLKLPYHQAIMNHDYPLTIGGGIGQSRLCMYFLRKAHVGEVQASLWSDEIIEVCKKNNIPLL